MEEEKTKRKNIVTIAIGVFVMLVLVIGSTYAFFQITGTTEDKTNTNFKGELESLTAYGTPHLSGTLSDLYITLNASDMALSKAPVTYWATNVKDSNYEEDRIDYTMSTASVSGGTVENGTLECTSDLTITATLVETEEGTEALENPFVKEDGYVYLSATSETSGNKGKINPSTIDLKTIVDAKEYKTKISYTIVGNTSVDIKAAINIINRNANQNALAGKRLTFDIKNENLTCNVGKKFKGIAYMKKLTKTVYGASDYYESSIFSSWNFSLLDGNARNVDTISFVDYLPSDIDLEVAEEGVDYIDLTDTSLSPEKSIIGWVEYADKKKTFFIGSESEIYAKDLSKAFMESMANIITFDNLNTSKTTDMSYMFNYANISNIIFPQGFGSGATNMSHMFDGYQGTSLDLSNFDTSEVTDMSYMFNYANISNIIFPQGFGSGATDMSYMFDGYQGETLDLSSFDTSKVTDMSWMFSYCSSLTTLDLSNFTFDNVKDEMYDDYGDSYSGFEDAFYNVSSDCTVKIKSSQQTIFEKKFTYDFTPNYVD